MFVLSQKWERGRSFGCGFPFFLVYIVYCAHSSGVERCPDKTEVLGSIPSARTDDGRKNTFSVYRSLVIICKAYKHGIRIKRERVPVLPLTCVCKTEVLGSLSCVASGEAGDSKCAHKEKTWRSNRQVF